MSLGNQPDYAPIHELQEMLRILEPIDGPLQDGVYGKETHDAVADFQRQNGMEATGVTDLETWDALKRASKNEKILQQPAAPMHIVLQPHQTLKKGCNNSHMYLVQGMMKALGNYISDLPAVDVNGRLDDKTEHAIKWLQGCCDLTQSGEVDKNTWRFLAHEYRSMVGDGTGTYPVRQKTPKPTEREPE